MSASTEKVDILKEFDNIDAAGLLELARLIEGAERFEDMCQVMGKLVDLKHKNKEALVVEERNMLSVAYKNVVGQRRASWRTLEGDKHDEDQDEDVKNLKKQYKQVVETELQAKCQEVLTLLEDKLLKKDENGNYVALKNSTDEDVETQVFYLKMCGDYYRYLAEFASDDKFAKEAENKYKSALELAKNKLAPTHPTRLGLALNASVCYYEILKNPQAACNLAKQAFDEAIQKLDSLSDSTYKDSTLIMQLLRDNLTIWTAEDTGSTNNKTIEQKED